MDASTPCKRRSSSVDDCEVIRSARSVGRRPCDAGGQANEPTLLNSFHEKDSEEAAAKRRRLDRGGKVRLEELPLMDSPHAWDTGSWSDYIWPLRKPDGVQQAAGLSKKVDTDTPSHFCCACYESGKPLLQCYLRDSESSQRNALKHHEEIHAKDGKWNGFTFSKIVDFEGRACGTIAGSQMMRENGQLVSVLAPSSRDELVRAATEWIVSTGQPLNATQNPSFQNMLKISQRICDPANLNIGVYAINQYVLKLAERRKKDVLTELKSLKREAFIQFDRWDNQVNAVNFSLFFMGGRGEGDVLKLEAYPISLSYAVKNAELGKMPGQTEVLSLLDEALKQCDLDRTVLAGGKLGNSMNNVTGILNSDGLKHYDPNDWALWTDWNSSCTIGCLSNTCDLVAVYAIGKKESQIGRDNLNGIPPSAFSTPYGANLKISMDAAEEANAWLSKEENFQRASTVAKEMNLTLLQPVLPDATRWNSILSCISRALDNYQILSRCETDKGTPVLTAQNGRMLAQVEGILEPLDVAQKLMQKIGTPFGPVALPLIYTLLRRYCISSNGIIDSWAAPDSILMKQSSFAVRCLQTGKREAVPCAAMMLESICLLQTLQIHLIYRFISSRPNAMMFEVLGMFLDPTMKQFAKVVCQPDGNKDARWTFTKTKSRVVRILQQFAERPSKYTRAAPPMGSIDMPATQESSDLDYLDLEAPVERISTKEVKVDLVEEELSLFLESSDGEKPELYKFVGLCNALESYNPLAFWSKPSNRYRFPTLYAANLVVLAYQPTSTFSESLFPYESSALHKYRNRLHETPRLASALVTLRHSMARDVAQASDMIEDEDDENPDQEA